MSAAIEPASVRAANVSDLDELVALARTLALSVQDPDPGGDPGPLVAAAFSAVFFTNLGLPRGLVTVVTGHAAFVLSTIYRLIGVRLDALSTPRPT